MAEQLIDFWWQAPVPPSQGFRWIEAARYRSPEPLLAEMAQRDLHLPPGTIRADTHEKGRWLVPDPEAGSRRYAPMRDAPALFRNFVELRATEEAILEFVARFGWLGAEEPYAEPIVLADGRQAWGSRLSVWVQEIAALRRVLELWDAVTDKNAAVLKRRIGIGGSGDHRWAFYCWTRPDPAAPYPQFPWREVIFDTRGLVAHKAERAALVKVGDRVLPARLFVADWINWRLTAYTAPRMCHDPHGALALQIVPKNLVGAMWLQFARATEGDARSYRRCLKCRTWFEVSLDAHRTNRRFCRDACRFKAYRERQTAAVKLRAEGKSLREIARILQSTPQTVKRWLQRVANDE